MLKLETIHTLNICVNQAMFSLRFVIFDWLKPIIARESSVKWKTVPEKKGTRNRFYQYHIDIRPF